MRRIIILTLILSLLFIWGCAKSENNLPEGFGNKEFYDDMVRSMVMILDSGENQNYELIEDIVSIGKKYSTEIMLNEKEKQVYQTYQDTLLALLVYSITGKHEEKENDQVFNVNNSYGIELSKKLIEFRESLE